MKQNNHDHKGTKKLKVILFAAAMLLPIGYVIPTMLYYGINEHAEAQTYIKEEPVYYETNVVNDASDLIIGNVYRVNIGDIPETGVLIKAFSIEGYDGLYTGYGGTGIEPPLPTLYYNEGSPTCYLSRSVEIDTQKNLQFVSGYIDFVFKSVYYGKVDNLIHKCPAKYVERYEEVEYTQDIVGAIEDAVQNTFKNTDTFWFTTNSPLFSTISAMTGVFGINSGNIINMVLVYWATITCIYIIFDIIIELFVYLTHLFSKEK